MSFNARIALAVVIAALLAAGCTGDTKSGGASAAQAGDPALPSVTITTAAGTSIAMPVEVADDDLERTCGLMFRTSLPENQGMLFVFRQDGSGGFWMRNTRIPLQIAYVSADGRIVDILEMVPLPDGAPPVIYTPRGPYRYAIEANTGWFDRNGIAPGDLVDVAAAVEHADAAAPPRLPQECR
jgi:uncharacterized protein